MPIPTYTPGYPPDGSSLGQTKATIRNNLDGTFETLGIDHVNNNGQPGSQPAGYHTIIHQVSQTSVSTVAGYNQVFSGVPGTLVVNGVTTPNIPPGGDTQLYSLTSLGGLNQITGSVPANNGYAWLGGVLLQWGKFNLSGSQGQKAPVSFNTSNVDFPNNCFMVQLTLICNSSGTSSSDNTLSVVRGSVTNTGFTFQYNGSGGSNYQQFYWLAIGN